MDRNIKAFLAVAETESITAACEQVGLTQSALTKTIYRLEQEFKTKLFRRSSRGMLLTEEGRILLDRALLIDMNYRQAHEEIVAYDRGITAEFTIAAGSAYHGSIGPDLIRQLRREFPKTQFRLIFEVADHTTRTLADGDIDLLLGAFRAEPHEGIDAHPLMNVEMTVYSCKYNSLAGLDVVEPDHLRGLEWVIYQRDRLVIDRINFYCHDHLLPTPRIAIEIDSLLASFSVVQRTSLVTAAATILVPLAENAGLAQLRMTKPLWRFQSGALFRQSMRNNPIMIRALAILEELVDPLKECSRSEI